MGNYAPSGFCLFPFFYEDEIRSRSIGWFAPHYSYPLSDKPDPTVFEVVRTAFDKVNTLFFLSVVPLHGRKEVGFQMNNRI
jgi:hypothetical protein